MIHEEEQKLHKSKRKEVIPRYILASPPYYQKEHVDEEFEQRAQNFEPLIHYVVEQEATTQGIRMSKGVELVHVTKQEIIVLPKAKPIVANVHVVVRLRLVNPNLINRMKALL